jgi:hypothetical protein
MDLRYVGTSVCAWWQHGPPCCRCTRTMSCSCGNSLPVGQWVTFLLLPCSCLPVQGASWSLDRKKGAHSLGPSFSRFESSGFFHLEVCKGHCLTWRSSKCEWVAWQLPELQSALPLQYLRIPGEELNTALMCVVPLMVPILRSMEHKGKGKVVPMLN